MRGFVCLSCLVTQVSVRLAGWFVVLSSLVSPWLATLVMMPNCLFYAVVPRQEVLVPVDEHVRCACAVVCWLPRASRALQHGWHAWLRVRSLFERTSGWTCWVRCLFLTSSLSVCDCLQPGFLGFCGGIARASGVSALWCKRHMHRAFLQHVSILRSSNVVVGRPLSQCCIGAVWIGVGDWTGATGALELCCVTQCCAQVAGSMGTTRTGLAGHRVSFG